MQPRLGAEAVGLVGVEYIVMYSHSHCEISIISILNMTQSRQGFLSNKRSRSTLIWLEWFQSPKSKSANWKMWEIMNVSIKPTKMTQVKNKFVHQLSGMPQNKPWPPSRPVISFQNENERLAWPIDPERNNKIWGGIALLFHESNEWTRHGKRS